MDVIIYWAIQQPFNKKKYTKCRALPVAFIYNTSAHVFLTDFVKKCMGIVL